jgi:Protein of unknown function (DUF3485)
MLSLPWPTTQQLRAAAARWHWTGFPALPVLAAAALLIASGLVHGLWTDRWQSPESLREAVARVDDVPLTVGQWLGHALTAPDVDPEAFAQAGAQGYWMRRYVNTVDGSEVTAILMCGHRSRIAVHPPEVCYRAAGYEVVEPAVRYLVKPTPGQKERAEFRTTRFSAPGRASAKNGLRIFWSWNAAGEWQAPDGDARWTFRGAPFLYKLYVVHELAGRGGPPTGDPAAAFISRLVPELQRTLFPLKP